MQRRWLISAVAALAMAAAPLAAAETAPPAAVDPAAPAAPPARASRPSTATTPEKPQPGAVVAQGTTAQPEPGQPSPTPAPEEKQPTPPPAPKFTYGGSADFYFSSNLNDPFTGFNALRAFDVKDERGPHLGLIDLWAQYARDPIGLRVDLAFGPTARLVNAFDPTDDDLWAHLQQLYVSANLNKKGTTYLDFGKWVTTAGAEVIEPKDNWLYSRGLLFNLAIPFYHLGARGYHYFNDTDYAMVSLHRGWNAVGKTGRPLGFALAGSKKLSDEWTFIGNYYGGVEGAVVGAGESYRNLFDFIMLYNPAGSKWAYTFNVDYVQQASAKLGGLSAQAKYTINPKSYAAFRGEFLLDDDFLGTNAYSLTAGYTHLFSKYFQTRVEYRHDFASQDVFANDRVGTFKANQGTFLISAIVSY